MSSKTDLPITSSGVYPNVSATFAEQAIYTPFASVSHAQSSIFFNRSWYFSSATSFAFSVSSNISPFFTPTFCIASFKLVMTLLSDSVRLFISNISLFSSSTSRFPLLISSMFFLSFSKGSEIKYVIKSATINVLTRISPRNAVAA